MPRIRFSTPTRLQSLFYLGIDSGAYPGDERFGLALGRLYVGHYGPKCPAPGWPHGWCAGLLDQHGCLP